MEEYDEFGNYIGPDELDEEASSRDQETISFINGLDPSHVRNVVLVGHSQHGKTLFMKKVYEEIAEEDNPDHYQSEQSEPTIKAAPMSILVKDSNRSSYLCNVMDTPGHVDFSDEVTASIRLADGAVLIVDVSEGVMLNTKLVIRQVLQEQLSVILVLNKFELLITELKLPPEDVYEHLKFILDQINAAYSTAGNGHVFDPALGNVCFASAADGWCFTLQSLAKGYVSLHGIPLDADMFASRLWGDYYFDPDSRTFTEQPINGVAKSFIEVLVKPLHELYNKIIKGDNAAYISEVKPLPRLACKDAFGPSGFVGFVGFVDMLVNHIPSAKAAQPRKIEHIYRGPKEDSVYQSMKNCSKSGSLMIDITKMYQKPNGCTFYALGRVYSGTIRREEEVRVLGEEYDSPDDKENIRKERVTNLWLPQFQHTKISIGSVPAGCWVFIEGVDASFEKKATLCDPELETNVYVFHPLPFNTIPVVKRTIEQPLYIDLSYITKSYLLAKTMSENSRWIISGTGELYLASINKELKETHTVKVEVSPPFVSLAESIVGSSSGEFSVAALDGQINITMAAEPLDAALIKDMEKDLAWPQERVQEFLQTNHNWEYEVAKSIWALQGTNFLLGGEFPHNVKDAIVQGFQLGVEKGPLCGAPIRAVKFRVLEVKIAEEVLRDGIRPIVIAAKRAVHSAFYKATPILMEPLYYVEARTPKIFDEQIRAELSMRDGHVIEELKLPWGVLLIIKASLPVNKSFGLDEAVRKHTQGAASCQSAFLHDWSVVPQKQQLELIMETRHRKGMREKEYNEDALQGMQEQEEQEDDKDAPRDMQEEDEDHDE